MKFGDLVGIGNVDAAVHPGDHHEIVLGQFGGDVARDPSAVRGGVAGADDGHSRLSKQVGVAEDEDQRRRVFDGRERPRALGLAARDRSGPAAAARKLG